MDALAVSAARLDDIDVVISMYEWLFAPPGARPAQWDAGRAASALRLAVASDDAVVLVATLGDEFVGFCTAYDDILSVRFGRRVWVEDLAVHPDRRSLGIGKRLLDEAKEWAKARGATHLELDSAETRADAHRFYEREQPSWRSLSFGWEL
ncbi:MAG TPA: GNAT family N-acetyltransferase [Solirubrobacteraceae bacterium]|nr:GNAT family N-acetyltransferase [Solirubrobacteraceae bacterium]